MALELTTISVLSSRSTSATRGLSYEVAEEGRAAAIGQAVGIEGLCLHDQLPIERVHAHDARFVGDGDDLRLAVELGEVEVGRGLSRRAKIGECEVRRHEAEARSHQGSLVDPRVDLRV